MLSKCATSRAAGRERLAILHVNVVLPSILFYSTAFFLPSLGEAGRATRCSHICPAICVLCCACSMLVCPCVSVVASACQDGGRRISPGRGTACELAINCNAEQFVTT